MGNHPENREGLAVLAGRLAPPAVRLAGDPVGVAVHLRPVAGLLAIQRGHPRRARCIAVAAVQPRTMMENAKAVARGAQGRRGNVLTSRDDRKLVCSGVGRLARGPFLFGRSALGLGMHASCQCGSLTAEIRGGAEPTVVACHCIDCQKRSGSPFGSMAYFLRSDVAITGEAREYARPTDSGNIYTTGFCPTCGSTVYGKASARPEIVGLTVGTIGDAALPSPARSVYEQSRHGWVTMPETTAGFVRGRDSERTR
jgi:antitoxin (DNA-binding transcriptional repressor) of toxin-antitoxin stability system